MTQIDTTKYSKYKIVDDHIGHQALDKNIINKTAVKKSKLCARFCQNVNKFEDVKKSCSVLGSRCSKLAIIVREMHF